MRGSWICLLSTLLLWSPLSHANIYRYQDANGMVHYTDNQLRAASHSSAHQDAINRDGVLVRVVEKKDGHYFFALNRLPTQTELTFRFTQEKNVSIPDQMQQVIRLPPREERFIGKLAAQAAGDWRYDYGFAYSNHALRPAGSDRKVQKIAGSTLIPSKTVFNRSLPPSTLSATIDLASPVAGRYRVTQGFNGKFSHNKPSNRYALDIALPIGTPLYATRDGVVLVAVDHHVGGGLKAKYRGKANHLRLRHADGTMTLYAHLQTGSLQVKKGDKVKAGQRVAASGHTGYSSGPHLHLAVQVDHQGRRESIPFTLQGSYPIAGRWLQANEWGDE
ncbi:murein DD-endopeptidase MepM/ murein hydrolase activator NlpD [Oceanisphaera litoralis]|uniref:peptidoglycan DD-metalloendopeptidase family protein n=1 Tax=Oceanisphaera litoralis TaxID=225144 RepID=UPI00195746E7|nr:peptidoglycan DD-metalloendopeptidase family protein [Oceanisphaera litoralis]MBM7456653.1 murein DD-endopeptidase MepM/ murein hydrolase activator NlpD [Oceanisphaera litoralis]